jgi:hypothetical protein
VPVRPFTLIKYEVSQDFEAVKKGACCFCWVAERPLLRERLVKGSDFSHRLFASGFVASA